MSILVGGVLAKILRTFNRVIVGGSTSCLAEPHRGYETMFG